MKPWLKLSILALIAAVSVVIAFFFDAPVHTWIETHQSDAARAFMQNISRFGDWPEHVALGLMFAGLAWLRGNKKWTRIFLSMLIACALAGVAARVIKIAAGRARPSVKTEEIWNGPSLSSRYHAFPSGHTAASAAFFGVLLFVSVRIGCACLPIPLLIGFSRMYVAAHYFSDVVFAAFLGFLCALIVVRWLLSTDRRPSSSTL